MPIARLQLEDGRVARVEVPEGMTPEDVQAWASSQDWSKYQQDDGFSFGEMVSNVPGSAANVAKGMWNAATNPIDTAASVGQMMAGVGQNLSDTLPEKMPGPDALWKSPLGAILDMYGVDFREYGDMAVEAVKDRYGSVDAALNTLEEDPVGVMVDVAGVIAPFAPKGSAALNPINASMNAVKAGAGKLVPKGAPKAMYEKVAKFSTTLPEKQRSGMIDTALDYRIAPSSKGVAKLEGLVDGFNTKINKMIQHAEATGKDVPATLVFKHLKELRQKKGGMSLGASDDLAKIDDFAKKFSLHLKNKNKSRLTPSELQELKVNTYKDINWDAKRMTGTPIKEDTYKAVARAAKEGVEQVAPGVSATNKELGRLYELQPHLARAANRIENKNIVSINDAPVVLAGTAAGGGAGATLAAVTRILSRDKIMSLGAMKLNDLVKDAGFQQFMRNNPNISQAELLAAISGREPTGTNQQEQR